MKSSHNFHVVEPSFPLSTKGIIGTDFLQKYLCKINCETLTIELIAYNKNIVVRMETNNPMIITTPPRIEIIHPLKFNLKTDTVILNKELQKDVY